MRGLTNEERERIRDLTSRPWRELHYPGSRPHSVTSDLVDRGLIRLFAVPDVRSTTGQRHDGVLTPLGERWIRIDDAFRRTL